MLYPLSYRRVLEDKCLVYRGFAGYLVSTVAMKRAAGPALDWNGIARGSPLQFPVDELKSKPRKDRMPGLPRRKSRDEVRQTESWSGARNRR